MVNPNQYRILSCIEEHLMGKKGPGAGSAVLNHPLMHIMKRKLLGHEQMLVFCELRYSVSPRFEKILAHAIEKAKGQEGKQAIAHELQMNLDDERGEGRATGMGAHGQWRDDFSGGLRFEVKVGKDTPQIYEYDEKDTLPTLVGMLLGAERAIPPEYERVLGALRQAMPGVVTDENDQGDEAAKKTSLYLRDHISHDAEHHFPEMLKAVLESFTQEQEIDDVIKGIKRFCDERSRLYTFIQQSLGLDYPRIRGNGAELGN